eukprot:gene15514-18381_t
MGFMPQMAKEHARTNRELQQELGEGVLVSNGIHTDETDGDPVLGDIGAVDMGGLEHAVGMERTHCEIREECNEVIEMCRRLEAKVRGVLVGDQLRIVENEVLTTLRIFIEQLARNGQRIRCELEDRQSFRDKKLQEKEKNLSKRAIELLNLAQQDDETVQVNLQPERNQEKALNVAEHRLLKAQFVHALHCNVHRRADELMARLAADGLDENTAQSVINALGDLPGYLEE